MKKIKAKLVRHKTVFFRIYDAVLDKISLKNQMNDYRALFDFINDDFTDNFDSIFFQLNKSLVTDFILKKALIAEDTNK